MQNYFAGKRALIIGAGQNIGRQIALAWARRGASVAVADISEKGAQETAALIRESGGEAIGIKCDVTNDASVAACIDAAEYAHGPIDIHMNNAGLLAGGNPEDIPVSEWLRMFDVNVFGMARANNIIAPKMIARRSGHIVNTASFAGLYPFACSRIHYAASKAAVVSMSENLALYLMLYDIRVSCLCPGPVMTNSPDAMKHFGESYVMRAPGSHLFVKSQQETAQILSDAMSDGKVIIPTHEEGRESIRQRGTDPDAFIASKNAEFMAGDPGKPQITQEVIASLGK